MFAVWALGKGLHPVWLVAYMCVYSEDMYDDVMDWTPECIEVLGKWIMTGGMQLEYSVFLLWNLVPGWLRMLS